MVARGLWETSSCRRCVVVVVVVVAIVGVVVVVVVVVVVLLCCVMLLSLLLFLLGGRLSRFWRSGVRTHTLQAMPERFMLMSKWTAEPRSYK